MDEELELEIDEWFEAIVDIGLDEHLSLLFKELEEHTESNVNNFHQYQYQ
jgi:hypothetical protein